MNSWYEGFRGNTWKEKVNVGEFIKENYIHYPGDRIFLKGPTERTRKLWAQCQEHLKAEFEKGGVLGIDTSKVSTIISHLPGYIDKDLEVIVGIQTEHPLQRAVNPFGGIRMAETACEEYGYTLNSKIKEIFTSFRKTHNEGVFDAYTKEMKLMRKTGLLTGLPDAYGRGRIIGDYRLVALYGVDRLICEKIMDLDSLACQSMDNENIILREEIAEQIKALDKLKIMSKQYGYDVGRPAANSREAVQWLYFGYLAAVKENNGDSSPRAN